MPDQPHHFQANYVGYEWELDRANEKPGQCDESGRGRYQMAGELVLTTFEHGTWGELTLTDAEPGLYERAVRTTQAKTVVCGVWTVYVTDLNLTTTPGDDQALWRYSVLMQGPLDKGNKFWGTKAEPLTQEAALVKDFGSLVQLFVLLESANIQNMGRAGLQNPLVNRPLPIRPIPVPTSDSGSSNGSSVSSGSGSVSSGSGSGSVSSGSVGSGSGSGSGGMGESSSN